MKAKILLLLCVVFLFQNLRAQEVQAQGSDKYDNLVEIGKIGTVTIVLPGKLPTASKINTSKEVDAAVRITEVTGVQLKQNDFIDFKEHNFRLEVMIFSRKLRAIEIFERSKEARVIDRISFAEPFEPEIGKTYEVLVADLSISKPIKFWFCLDKGEKLLLSD